MKHLRSLGLCLVGMFALVAVAATSASAAEPEWGRCVTVKSKGHFENGSCTKEDFKENKKHEKKYKGKFEWLPGAADVCYAAKHGRYENSECTEEDVVKGKAKGTYEKTGGPRFTSEMAEQSRMRLRWDTGECLHGTAPVPHSDCGPEGYMPWAGGEAECHSEQASGEVAGTDEVVNVSIRFRGCVFGSETEHVGVHGPATTPGLSEGELQFAMLKGRLGYTNRATHEVGLLLEPATAGALITEFQTTGYYEPLLQFGVGNATEGSFYEAAGTPGEPTGHNGFIATVSPVNVMTSTLSQNNVLKEEVLDCTEAYCNEPPRTYPDYVTLPARFEGGPLEEMETLEEPYGRLALGKKTEWDSGGMGLEGVDSMEGAIEIKA